MISFITLFISSLLNDTWIGLANISFFGIGNITMLDVLCGTLIIDASVSIVFIIKKYTSKGAHNV